MALPILRAVAKTHKKVEESGMPKSRPECDVSNCYSMALSDILSDMVVPINQANKEKKRSNPLRKC